MMKYIDEMLECQECGMMVLLKEFHDFECCKQFKLSKIANLSEFEIKMRRNS